MTACADDDERLNAGAEDDFEVGVPVHFESDNVYVVALQSGGFKAFFDRDPRTGCPVQFPGRSTTSDLVSPALREYGTFDEGCHGSAYDIEGERVFGPSSFDLTEYPVQIEGDSVVVSLDAPRCQIGEGEDEDADGCVVDVLEEVPPGAARTPEGEP